MKSKAFGQPSIYKQPDVRVLLANAVQIEMEFGYVKTTMETTRLICAFPTCLQSGHRNEAQQGYYKGMRIARLLNAQGRGSSCLL